MARAADKQAVETARARARRRTARARASRSSHASVPARSRNRSKRSGAVRVFVESRPIVAARDKKAEAALVAEQQRSTRRSRSATPRSASSRWRGTRFAERRELKASAAAADASRRVERLGEARNARDALERVKHAPCGAPRVAESQKKDAGVTGSIGSPKPTPTPPRLSPAKSARTKRAHLSARELSRAGGVPGASCVDTVAVDHGAAANRSRTVFGGFGRKKRRRRRRRRRIFSARVSRR